MYRVYFRVPLVSVDSMYLGSVLMGNIHGPEHVSVFLPGHPPVYCMRNCHLSPFRPLVSSWIWWNLMGLYSFHFSPSPAAVSWVSCLLHIRIWLRRVPQFYCKLSPAHPRHQTSHYHKDFLFCHLICTSPPPQSSKLSHFKTLCSWEHRMQVLYWCPSQNIKDWESVCFFSLSRAHSFYWRAVCLWVGWFVQIYTNWRNYRLLLPWNKLRGRRWGTRSAINICGQYFLAVLFSGRTVRMSSFRIVLKLNV